MAFRIRKLALCARTRPEISCLVRGYLEAKYRADIIRVSAVKISPGGLVVFPPGETYPTRQVSHALTGDLICSLKKINPNFLADVKETEASTVQHLMFVPDAYTDEQLEMCRKAEFSTLQISDTLLEHPLIDYVIGIDSYQDIVYSLDGLINSRL